MTSYDGVMRMDDALGRHYVAHHLPQDGGLHTNWFRVHIVPISIPLPNPPARREAVLLHDMIHILTGYDTVFSDGEMRIAAYEVGAGCGRVWVAWLLNVSLMAYGILYRPRDTVRAFARGRAARSIYTLEVDRAELRAMTVAELSARLQLDVRPPEITTRHVAECVLWSLSPWVALLGLLWSAAGLLGLRWP